MSNVTTCAAAALAISLACGAARAQTEAGDVVVVTGAALPAPAETLGSALTVLDGARLRLGGYDTAGDALRLVPGLAVNRTGGPGGLTQVRTRGADGNHTVVLLDGIDISPATDGETDLSTLLLGDVARIEVLRGPQSGLYGANALAGAINVITRRPGAGRFHEISAEAGSFETYRLAASAGTGGDGDYLTGAALYRATEGYDVSALGAPGAPSPYADDKEGDRALVLSAHGGLRLSDALRVDGFVRHLDKRTDGDGFDFSGVPGLQGHAVDDPSVTDSESLAAAGSATLSLAEDRSVTIVSVSRVGSETDGGTFGSEASRSRAALQSSLRFDAPGLRATLTGFAEARRETFRNTVPFDPSQAPEQSRDLLGAGAELRAEVADQLFLSGVVRHDANEDFRNAETFSLAAAWLVPGAGARIHASLGTGVANPSFYEQFGFVPGTFTGNPDLRPERATGWDFGLEQSFADGRAVLDATYFQSDLEDAITPCFPSVCNAAGESERRGVELSARFAATETLDISAAYTWLDAEDPDGRRPTRRPEHAASLDAVWRADSGRTRLLAGVIYTGEQLDDDFRGGFTAVQTALDEYVLVRLAASRRLTDRLELFGRIENALDADYEEVLTYRAPGRAVFVGLRLSGGADRRPRGL